MSFKRAKSIITSALIICIPLCMIGLLSGKDSELRSVMSLIAFGVIVFAAFIWFMWCKCPHCGTRLFRKVVTLKKCPYCGKSFVEKEKKEEPAKKIKRTNPYEHIKK